jgi:hypothetical protein
MFVIGQELTGRALWFVGFLGGLLLLRVCLVARNVLCGGKKINELNQSFYVLYAEMFLSWVVVKYLRVYGVVVFCLRGWGNREWRKLHNEELNDLYSLPNIVRGVKSRRMRWAGHVARMGGGQVCTGYWWGSRRGKKPLGRPRRKWEDNTKRDLEEVEGVVGTGWSGLRIGTVGGHLWVR